MYSLKHISFSTNLARWPSIHIIDRNGPFVPQTMERVRQSLNLPENVFSLEQLGTPIMAGHSIGEKLQYFPAVEGASKD